MLGYIICPQCGEENSGKNLYCDRCSTSLIGVKRQEKLPPVSQISDEYDGEYIYRADSYVRERGGCLSLWLLALMGLTLLQAVLSFSGGPLAFIQVILSLCSFGFALALWNWKKWGAYGLGFIWGLLFILGLIASNFLVMASSLFWISFLFFLVSLKWDWMD